MIETLKFTQIVISILLIIVVLIQNKWTSLNLTTMSDWMNEITRRWPEKVLHNITIILWTLFTLNALSLFILR